MQSDFLQPGEEPLLDLRRNPRSALDAWLGIVFLWAIVATACFVAAAFVTAKAVPYSIAIAIVATLLALAAGIAVGLRVRTTRMVVTADRVYHAYGKFRFFLSQTTYDRVTDLHVHQSFFGRRFGFGTVTVQTSGLGVGLVGVNDPLRVKETIERAREGMIRHLVARHARAAKSTKAGATAPTVPLVTPVRGGAPHWTGGPAFASVIVRYLGPIVFLAFFFLFSGATTVLAASPFAVLLPIGVALVGGLVAWNAIMQFRRTTYEIHAWGVAVASGWLSRRRVEARYEKVTDVTVIQPILGRLFGFGTLQINTAGSNEAAIQFHGVRRPDEVKALVDQARTRRSNP